MFIIQRVFLDCKWTTNESIINNGWIKNKLQMNDEWINISTFLDLVGFSAKRLVD